MSEPIIPVVVGTLGRWTAGTVEQGYFGPGYVFFAACRGGGELSETRKPESSLGGPSANLQIR